MFCWKPIGFILKWYATLNRHVLLKSDWFYLKNCTRDDDSRATLFFTEIGRPWRHSDDIYGRHMRLGFFFFFFWSWYVKLMPGGVCEVWGRYLISLLALGRKVEGAVSPPPPSGRGLRVQPSTYVMKVSWPLESRTCLKPESLETCRK